MNTPLPRSPVTATWTGLVTPSLTTVHLPLDRAVLTTPGMVGLMERCIADAEAPDDRRQTRSVEIRHRAGLKTGETLIIRAELVSEHDGRAVWSVTATSGDGRAIGDGTIVRERVR